MSCCDALTYDVAARTFALCREGRTRLVFDDLAFTFRMTRVSLRAGRVMPEPAVRQDGAVRLPLRLRAAGSRETLRLADPPARLTCRPAGDALLIGAGLEFHEPLLSPDEAARLTVSAIPGLQRAVLFHNRSDEFQNFDCEGLWWSQAEFSADPVYGLHHDWGLLLLWQDADGSCGGLLPVTTDRVIGRLRAEGANGLSACCATGCTGAAKEFPLLLCAFGDRPESVWDALLGGWQSLCPSMHRREGEIPEPFDRLGWCSWNAFGKDVTADDIRQTLRRFRELELPVRYIILDDGWLDAEAAAPDAGDGVTQSRLRSCDPHPQRFPGGLKGLIAEARSAGIGSFGIWHTLNGYWEGLAPEHPFVSEHPDCVVRGADGLLLPRPGSEFFTGWYRRMAEWGVDFTKVDNQGFARRFLPYRENLARYTAGVQQDLQSAAAEAGMPILHCMATHPETAVAARGSDLLRVSNDFNPNDAFGARRHVINNFYNTVWLGSLFWPDFDMFQTHDLHAETMARMLAVSESPVYTTDEPERINADLLRRLALPDGSIPRYEQPARPLASRFFRDPYQAGDVLAVRAVHGDAVTVGLFNVCSTGEAANGVLAWSELGLPDTACAWYSDASQQGGVLQPGEALRYSLKALESDLVSLAPIADGAAVIGVVDYLAAPAVVENVQRDGAVLRIRTATPGRLVVALGQPPRAVRCDGVALDANEQVAWGGYDYRDGFLHVGLTQRSVEIEMKPLGDQP